MTTDFFTTSRAEISDCRQYRYSLHRIWNNALPPIAFGMLNPSTADAIDDDATIIRCLSRAERLGFGSLIVWNLFALRATNPNELKISIDPIGPLNDIRIIAELEACISGKGVVVAAWGNHGALLSRNQNVMKLLRKRGIKLRCLGTTAAGHPRHPLYVPYDQRLLPFEY
jgi:hypothetical protein